MLIYDDVVAECFFFFFSGLTEEDFVKVAEFFDRAVNIALHIKGQTGNKIKDYRQALEKGAAPYPELVKLHDDVTSFSRQFPTIGF